MFQRKIVFILLSSLCIISALNIPSRCGKKLVNGIVLNDSMKKKYTHDEYDISSRKIKLEPAFVSTREARVIGPFMALMTPIFGNAKISLAETTASKFDDAINTYFPGSISSTEITYRLVSALRKRGYKEGKTLIGSSLCSDEINDTSSSFVTILAKKLTTIQDGGIFNLGGLGGLPFVGTSGFAAFTSHCPVSGKIVIVFGPHVGVSNDGIVGKVERIGKSKPSTSCGAAVGAYKAMQAGVVNYEAPYNAKDFQEEFIIKNLRKKLGVLAEVEKKGDSGAVAFVTQQMYNLVWDIVRENVEGFTSKPGFWDTCTEVTLLGGILVNRGHGVGLLGGDDLFQPLTLTTIAAAGETNIYGDVFGDLKAPRSNVDPGFNRKKIKEVKGAP